MTRATQRIFREAAIDRLSSPDQLDQLVGVTRPVDWLAALAIAATIVALLAWGFLGSIPTRVSGEGIVIGYGGTVADAVAATGGRLSTIDVAVGERVRRGQPIARLAQADTDERYRAAVAVLHEREREYAEFIAARDREERARDSSDAARKAGLQQAAAAAEDRATVLTHNVKTTEGLIKQGLATQPDLDQMRVDLSGARQRLADSKNAILTLDAERMDRQAQSARDQLAARFRVDDARRESEQLADTLGRETQIVSPIDGRVTEVKVSPGAVLAVGAPVVAIDSADGQLQVLVYLPADAGKLIRPGMRARVEPATVKREEYGAMIGQVISISPFPATPEGMAATLHNTDLVARFGHGGALYGAVIQLVADPRAPSGYRWSSGRGPAIDLTSGTLAHAEIITRERRPVDLLLPLIRRMSGSDN